TPLRLGPAQCRHGDARGLEVSPGSLLQNELIQRQIGNRLAQPATKTSTRRNFATISSGLYRFLAITVLLDVRDIPQVGPLQWGRITTTTKFQSSSNLGLRQFMHGCVLRLPTWMRATSPKATSLIASGECQEVSRATVVSGGSEKVVG